MVDTSRFVKVSDIPAGAPAAPSVVRPSAIDRAAGDFLTAFHEGRAEPAETVTVQRDDRGRFVKVGDASAQAPEAAPGTLVPLREQQAALNDPDARAAREGAAQTPSEEETPLDQPAEPAIPAAEPEPEAEGQVEPEPEAVGEGGGEDETWLTVGLPGREPDDPEFELQLDSPEAVERVNQLKNMAMRGQEHARRMAAVEEREGLLRSVEEEIAVDPGGFLIVSMPVDRRAEVALRLMADDETYRTVVSTLNEWVQNPHKRVADAATWRADAVERRGAWQQEASAREEGHRLAVWTRESVAAALPETVSAERAAAFETVAHSRIADFTRRANRLPTEHEIARLIDEALAALDLARSASLAASPGHERNGRAATTRGVSPPAAVPAGTGERIRKKVQARKRLAVTAPAGAPAGAGSAPEALKPPPGTGVAGAVEHLKRLTQAGQVRW